MMKEKGNKLIAFMTAFIFAFTGAFMFNGMDSVVYADVGSISDDQETTYTKSSGLLGSLGIDTSKMPETYDADSTSNPYGSDVTTLEEMNELVKIDTSSDDNKAEASLYGHNSKLDGSYETLTGSSIDSSIKENGPGKHAFLAVTDVDVNGAGRDSGAAMVYTNYRHYKVGETEPDHNIYMKIFNPKTGEATEPFVISSFIENRYLYQYEIQSQLQIVAGDFDNDRVDEIAVYVPAAEDGAANRVAIYDLTNGTECADPYNKAAWQNSWNYVLPKSSAQIIQNYEPKNPVGQNIYYFTNIYNNLDLAAGDADNDGACDLVISYGASDVSRDEKYKKEILRSLPSESVLLYGSNGTPSRGGQMLKERQMLSYGDDDLIRVSFAFGDLDGDGNEEMIMGGQRQSEQDDNVSRCLGKYTYDKDVGGMILETSDNVSVVAGSWNKDADGKRTTFASANGWDGEYYSIPVMKTNIAVGNIYGQSSQTKIYMDSCLYSYDGSFSLVDELEDSSPDDPDKPDGKKKGSAIFTDIKGLGDHTNDQAEYFEYGASAGNYTMSEGDYLLTHRITMSRAAGNEDSVLSDATMVVPEENDDKDLVLTRKSTKNTYQYASYGAPVTLFASDTDIDSATLHYTGNHEIEYTEPRVLAVLASAPYYKDVANYDESGDMLAFSGTKYGESSGNSREHSVTMDFNLGVYTNHSFKFGSRVMGWVNLIGMELGTTLGYKYSREKIASVTNRFEVNYGTAGGENEVVLFSTPVEKYEYQVTTGAVDEDGNVSTSTSYRMEPHPHQPVTVTMPIEDYMEIQEKNSDDLPDLTKYITSKPGYPETYPSSKSDLPKAVKDGWDKYHEDDEYAEWENEKDPNPDYDHPDVIKRDEYLTYIKDAWEGAGYGNGFIEQSISRETDNTYSSSNGCYWNFHLGARWEQELTTGVDAKYEGGVGLELGAGGGKGMKYGAPKGVSCSGTVANMPRSAKEYGYYFSWTLMKYMVYDSADCAFPVISYLVKDTDTAPPILPDKINQDFDQTTDSQIGLVWDYSDSEPSEFKVYRYKDFPQGGGDELVGTVSGSDYTIRKDANNQTITDSNGKPIREYSFVENGLTADTKYNYRLKVVAANKSKESIFSPIIQARTDVSEKPEISLSTDKLTIYPDETSVVSLNLANPGQYETGIDYQWQKYSANDREWKDMENGKQKNLAFYSCKSEDAGQYRCRVNLVRKRESSPQYISAFSGICEVSYSKKDVVFDPIEVFQGEGQSFVNTGLEVKVSNASATGTAKPGGKVYFTISGPNGELRVYATIDPKTGYARINSLEDLISSLSVETFVDGGYLITASYEGDDIFYPSDDPEEYHYLRNIDECVWLSMQSGYSFGEDVLPTSNLYDYKKQDDGSVQRTDITDQITKVKFFAVDENQEKTGDAVAEYTMSDSENTVKIPLNEKLKKRAWVEVYTDSDTQAAGHQVIRTSPMQAEITLSGKVSGCGDLFKAYSFEGDDVSMTGDGSLTEKNMVAASGGDPKSLEDLLKFRYYEASGEKMFDSTDLEEHPEYADQFIPAVYGVDVLAKDKESRKLYETFYSIDKGKPAEFLVVGSYYEVTAVSSDENAGAVRLISPILEDKVDKIGFSGGSKITLKALPVRGFRIKSWKIEDGQGGTKYQNGGDLLTYTLRSDPTISSGGQVKITAEFEPKNNTLTYEAKGEGTLSVKPAFVSGSTVLEGTEMQFSARAAEGWHFKEWRMDEYGGNSSIAAGMTDTSGINSKTYTMGSNAAAVYAIFMRDTIDLDLHGDLKASYINNGENPVEETGKEIDVEKGRNVPKGTQVRVKTAPGFVLGEDAQWSVTITTPDGTSQVEAEEFTEGTSEGCAFTLPPDVTACSVETITEKGSYVIGLDGDNVSYVVKLDDSVIPEDKYDEKLQRISAGTHVEIEAQPERGKLFNDWIVNGDPQKSADKVYSFTLMDSVTVEAAVKDDTAHTAKVSTTGGGTGVLTIIDHNGKPVEETFGADQKEIAVYEGESLSLCGSPDDPAHIMTEVTMDGKSQDLTDGVFTLESVTEDLTFVCRFQPTTFCSVGFRSDVSGTQPKILDSSGAQLDDGEVLDVGTGETLAFSVVVDKNDPCHVSTDEGSLELKSKEEDETTATYHYELKNITKNAIITIDDQTEYVISNWDEFDAFMKHLNEINASGSKERPQAVVTADITMPEDVALTLCSGEFNGTLDGQGHTIKGLRLGAINDTGTAYYNGEPALFNKIGSKGCVKNLTIEDFQAYYEFIHSDGSQSTSSDTEPTAMITQENKGTISGIMLKDCLLYSCIPHNYSVLEQPVLAGIAVSNAGTVEACRIIGLKLYADRYERGNNTVGSAVVFKNESGGIIRGCYIEGLKLWNSAERDYLDAKREIIAMESGGSIQGNYYRVAPEVSASNTNAGTNVLTITENQDDREKAEAELNSPAFGANLAWHINKDAGQLWSVPQVLEDPANEPAGDEMIAPLIEPLDLGLEGFKAPVRAEFKAGELTKNIYLYPSEYNLPGEASFGDDAPDYWQCGDLAYSANYGPIEISKDMNFTGVTALTDCVAKLTTTQGTACYKQLKDALAAAEGCIEAGAQLDIVADCAMESGTFTVSQGMTVVINSGAALTMKKPAQINNNGTFDCAQGGTLHKRGTIVNAGTIKVNGDFYNYGSKLKNTGTIENRKNIICKPHLMGAWQAADAPNEDGSWTKTSVCEICTNEITKKEDPNPAADEVESIEVYQYPAKAEYVTSDAFSSDGLVIAANLKDGGKALVTGYELTISDEKTEARPIADGDILDSPGAKQITARYEGFECAFPIRVTSLITGISIEAGGREVVKGETLQLKANVTPTDVPVKITWSSANESVATVDENGLVKGIAGGHTEITATVEGLSASCVIRVHEAAVRMELDQDMILVPKSGSGLIAARVTPATANGEVTWTLPDTSAAGFYVTDEQTGEVTLSKTITTKLSPGAGAESSAYVAVTGLMEGQTTVTAATADARGAMINRTCSVEVKQADAGLRLTYGDALVSGTTLNLDATEKEIQLEAESTEPDDTLQWFTVDDNIDPVIEVDDTGRVTLLRTGSAAVGVTSGKSGLTDFCVLRVETRPVSVILSGSSLRLAAGTVKMLTAQLDPKTADGTIVWRSSDETVAKVSDGVITGVRPGTAIVTAQSSEDPSVAASCKVRVLDTKITLKLSKTKFYYNGKGHYPAVTIYSGDTMLADKIKKSNEDVVLIRTNGSIRPGTHTITATVKEDGMGTAAASFRILVKPTKIKKIIKGNKQFTIKWKKQSKHCVTGYQIRYSLKKSMKKSRKKTVSNYKKTALTVKKLKAKKIYYVQVRTYKKIGSWYYYSAWSKVKKVRTK